MSRNKERLGGVQKPDTGPPPAAMQQTQAEGFSFVVPTEFVELPSGGKYYAEDHPLHNAESIEIRQMTAKEEDLLTSRTLIKKGVALDRVIKNIIVDRRINPDTLLTGDRNAIIIATRITGYGHIYETKVSCPNCAAQQQYSFDLTEATVYDGADPDEDDQVNDHGDGTFTTTLPRIKLPVTFRLLTGKDERSLMAGMETDRKRKNEQSITRQLRNMIVAVDGQNAPQVIDYLVDHLPSMDSRQLRMCYRLAAPNVDLTQHFECAECDFAQDMEVPLTADFFWPDR
ncbi:hypothetical protein CMI47_06420 [Candidatus Pacearchaeota archaeon]|nr:hypothetical protein [Candidatus Pacearchaeota archaeon]